MNARLQVAQLAEGRCLLVFDQMPAGDRLDEWADVRQRLEAELEVVAVMRFDYRVDLDGAR